MGFGVWGLGFGVWCLGFGVWGLGFGVWSSGLGVWGLGCGVRGLGFGVNLSREIGAVLDGSEETLDDLLGRPAFRPHRLCQTQHREFTTLVFLNLLCEFTSIHYKNSLVFTMRIY